MANSRDPSSWQTKAPSYPPGAFCFWRTLLAKTPRSTVTLTAAELAYIQRQAGTQDPKKVREWAVKVTHKGLQKGIK